MDMKRVLTGVVILSVLTGCGGGGGGLSAEDQAAQAAAQAAAAAAAAQTLASAKEIISATLPKVTKSASDAKTASTAVAALATPVEQQATSYQESNVAAALNTLKGYVTQAVDSAAQAETQQALVTKLQADTQASQDLALLQKAAQQAQQAATLAEQARLAAEQALQDAQTAVTSLTAAMKVADAAKRYTKLDAGGNTLSASATSWACVKDNNTGLVWETKTDDGGLRDKDWRYRHMHNYGGYGNYKDTNGKVLCEGLNGVCDAYSYIYAVNGTGLCGRNNWRLPIGGELGSIAQINGNGEPPHINQVIFPRNIYKPGEAAYCAMNTNTGADAEHNYQGVDYGRPLLNGIQTKENLENSILVALRHYGEIPDGLVNNPDLASNWICYTRLVSGGQ